MAGIINNALNTGTIPLSVSSGGTGGNTIPSNGQIPIGNGSNYVAASITAGANITVTPGPGTLTIASTGGSGGFTYVAVPGTTQLAVAGTGYIPQSALTTTITLPAGAPLGSIVAVQGQGAGGWILAASSAGVINVGQTPTSLGGSVSSANTFDAIQVVNLGSDIWGMASAVTAGFTVI